MSEPYTRFDFTFEIRTLFFLFAQCDIQGGGSLKVREQTEVESDWEKYELGKLKTV